MAEPEILAYGEPMVEFNRTGAEGGRAYLQGFGGDTSNFAVAAARQGARVGYVSAVGDDAYGRMLRGLWEAEGVDATHVRTDPAAPTGIYFVDHGPAGHAFTFFRTGSAASRYAPSDLPLDAVRRARALHLSGISLAVSASACDAGYAAVHAARAAGATVSFDTNLRLRLWSKDRARATITDMIGLCDVCLPSLDDVAAIWGVDDPDALADRCLALGARTVALKMGDRGALVADRATRLRIPPAPCRPVDATGAGDAFAGAFVARLLAGDGIEAAGRYAAVAAALSTEGYGAVEPVPRADAVRRAMAERLP